MNTHYSVIADKAELERFIAWLPDLHAGEAYYGALLARHKYVKELGLGAFNSDRHQCARFLTTKDRLFTKIWQTEAPKGSYIIKDAVIPQEALAFYLTPNPRSMVKAQPELMKRLVDNLAQRRDDVNVMQDTFTAVHRSVSRKIFVDFDVDTDDFDLGPVAKRIAEVINPEAVSIVGTRGGYHVLVKLEDIQPQYKKTWYNNMRAVLNGVDIIGDTRLPVPGTYQGMHIPRFFTLQSLLSS